MNHPVRILVVDDDPDILHATARLLEKAGYTVDRAASGEEALQAVQKHRPELLLLDHDLPGIDGAEVRRLIKLDPALADTLVVIVSASHAESDQQAEGLESGADGYIGRPIANRELLARVESYVRIQHQSRLLRLQVKKLKKSNIAIRQAHLASLNLMEDVITARDQAKQAFQALRESEKRFRRLADSTWEGILIHREGVILDANEAAFKMFGWSAEEAIGKGVLEYLAPESIEPVLQKLKESINTPQIYIEAIGLKKDKTVFPIELRGKPIKYKGLEARVVAIRDLTRSKQAEQGLRESELRLRSIANSAKDAILMMDSAGRVSYWNPAAERILGYTQAEAIGQNLHSLLAPPRYQAAHQAAFPEFVQTGQGAAVGKTLDLAARRKDGQEISVQLSLSAIPINGDWHAVGILRDITERKRAEEALLESEEKYRAIFEGSGQGILAANMETMRFDYANPSICRMLGYSEAELLQLGMEDIHPEDARDQFMAVLALQRSAEKALATGLPCLRKDGTVFYADVTAVETIIHGRVYMVGFFSDVTDRRRMESELSEAHQDLEKKVQERTLELGKTNTALAVEIEERKMLNTTLKNVAAYNRSLFESNIDPFVTINLEGKFTDANHAAEVVTGFSRDELIGMDWTDYFTDPDAAQAGFQKVFSQGELRDYELQLRHRNGKITPVLCSGSLYRDESGKVIGALGVARDITDKKQAEEVLRKSEARFKNLLQDVQAVAVQGYAPDGTTQYWNKASEQFYGYAAEEAIGRNLLDLLIPPEMRGDVEQAMRQMDETGQPIPAAELSLMRKDGSRLVVYSSHTIVQIPGQKQELFCIDIDMSDRKQAEQDRIAREVAEKANRAKSIFVANMSHEIRTPMNAILGFAQVLAHDPTLTPLQVGHVRTIHRSGGHLLRLINDILDMSKIEAGTTTLNETVFCLHDLLDDIMLMFRARADSQGLQLLLERDESVPRYVTADEGKLRQVLVNLLGNAVKFTATGGVTVRVRAEAVEGKTAADNKSLRMVVEVEDSGPGIPDEDIGRIFDLFQQAGAGVKSGGTGLGLAISRSFVEMMGGSLTVKSQVGAGSSFHFDLLLKSAAEVAGREKRASRRIIGLEPGTGPVRILAVDDAPTNRALLCALLRPVGFEVVEAGNGVEALDIFAKWSPHAVLMDMRMPVMDGYEATRRIKSTEAGRATPVIAITASAFEKNRQQIMASGVDAYVRKPFRMEEICEVLGKYLGLRYVFAARKDKIMEDPAPASLNPETRLALPQEIIQAMRQALERGDSARLRELIAQVENLDSATAGGLQALLERYDYEKLGQWLGAS